MNKNDMLRDNEILLRADEELGCDFLSSDEGDLLIPSAPGDIYVVWQSNVIINRK
jgi:hypothetical protein